MIEKQRDPNSTETIIPVVVQPDEVVVPIPTEADLSSHYKELTWRDGVELLAEGASIIPLAGPAIKKSIEMGAGVGKYSPEERLTALNWQWLTSQLGQMRDNLNLLVERLPSDEQPQAADVAAVIQSVIEASEKTADYKKRQLLQNALVNAFDIEQYQAGMTLRLIDILKEVEYGDVELLGRILRVHNEVLDIKDIDSELEKELPRNDNIALEHKRQIVKAKKLFKDVDLSTASMFHHHLSILEKHGLVVVENLDSRRNLPETYRRKVSWESGLMNENYFGIKGGQYTKTPEVTVIGRRFLRFVLNGDDKES